MRSNENCLYSAERSVHIEKRFVENLSAGDTTFVLTKLGLSSIPAVSMDRWRSPSDNRYARNAGVSIRYKK